MANVIWYTSYETPKAGEIILYYYDEYETAKEGAKKRAENTRNETEINVYRVEIDDFGKNLLIHEGFAKWNFDKQKVVELFQ